MPVRNAPDDEDVYNILASIGEDYAAIVEFTTTYHADYIQTVARAYKVGNMVDKVLLHQALHRSKYRPAKQAAQVAYTLAFDLWCQFDGGGATAAQRGPAYGWNGRVETPRRRR